jgi:hypothetical protein
MNPMLAGALRSKMVYVNVLLAVLSALELMGAHLTELFGTKVSAAVLLVGALTNIVLRTVTTQSLAEKAAE